MSDEVMVVLVLLIIAAMILATYFINRRIKRERQEYNRLVELIKTAQRQRRDQ